MHLIPFLAALLSAITHAGWNAAARARPDPGAAITATVMMAGVISLPFVAVMGIPPLAAWPWLALGIIFNTGALRLLMATYRSMPFSMGYPLMRGSIPLAVVGLNAIFLPHGLPSPLGLLGIVMISGGVMLLARSGRTKGTVALKPVLFALGGGLSAGAYVLTDVMGIAATGDSSVYGLSAAIINAVAMPLILRLEGKGFGPMLWGHLRFGFVASLFSMGSYVLFLYALSHGPIGPASALRETSVLFALVIAVVTLKERVGPMRWFACGLAFAGTALLRLA